MLGRIQAFAHPPLAITFGKVWLLSGAFLEKNVREIVFSGQMGEFLLPPTKQQTAEAKCCPSVAPNAIRNRAAIEINHYHIVYVGEKWCRQRDLNSRPSDYKSDALPTEL